MILYIVSMIVLVSLVLFNWLVSKSIIYPGFLQSIEWLFIVVILYYTKNLFYSISANTIIIIVLGVIVFSFGSYLEIFKLNYIKYNSIIPEHIDFKSLPSQSILNLFLICLVPFFTIILKKVLYFGENGPTKNFFINLRSNMTWSAKGTAIYGGIRYIYPLLIIITGLNLFWHLRPHFQKSKSNKNMKSSRYFWISMFMSVLFSILLTGRTFLFFLIIFVFGIYIVSVRPDVHIKFIAIMILISLGIFAAYSIVLSKGFSSNLTFMDNVKSMFINLLTYIAGPSVAFDKIVTSADKLEWGSNTFRFFYVFLRNSYHLNVKSLIQQYVYIPFPVNTYTVYAPYYKDFGIIGVFFFQFIFGLWHGFLYRKIVSYNIEPCYVLLYSLFLYPLVMQFFQDQYFSLTSMWIQYILYVFIFTKLLSYKTVSKNRRSENN